MIGKKYKLNKENVFYGMRKGITGGTYGRTRGMIIGVIGDIFIVVDEYEDNYILYSHNHHYGTVYTKKETFWKIFTEVV